ncbi:MAG: transcriptional regulator LysR family [Cyanobacteria bacterium RYN_339]|nr:transcriptional regulator LysR family [Cyanobacteria bacterium RYN_339]
MVNLDALRYFLAAAATGSFQAAAERVHVTPQAVSKAVASLEAHYKVKLFERDQRLRRLTPAGQTLLDQVPGIMAGLENIEQAIADHRSRVPVGPISIAGVAFVHNYLLPRLLANLVVAHPRIRPRLLSMSHDQVEERVAAGEVDLGVLFARPQRQDLAWEGGLMNPSVIVALPQAFTTWDALKYVVPPATLDGWPDGRFRRKVSAEVDLLEVAIHLCEAGVGAAFVPELAVRERIRLGTLAIVAEPPVDVANPFYVVRRAGIQPSPAAEVVLAELAALLGEAT